MYYKYSASNVCRDLKELSSKILYVHIEIMVILSERQRYFGQEVVLLVKCVVLYVLEMFKKRAQESCQFERESLSEKLAAITQRGE